MYSRYYDQHDLARNDLLANPEVTFQTFAFDRANIRALQRMEIDRNSARVLDVGCGSGAGLIPLVRLGFPQENMSGVDIRPERIEQAKKVLPMADFKCQSAEAMTFGDAAFDLVLESTMFVLLPSEDMARRIAHDMLRVTKPGGYLMLIDWRYSKPGSDVYNAMSKKRVAELFDVGGVTRLIAREKGALVPPLGRALSKYAPSLYFLAQALFPPAVGQITTVLRKA